MLLLGLLAELELELVGVTTALDLLLLLLVPVPVPVPVPVAWLRRALDSANLCSMSDAMSSNGDGW